MKRNRLFSLILIVTMFFSLYTQSGVAAEESTAAFDVVAFEYCNGSGTPIDVLSANGVVKVNAVVRNNVIDTADVTLMLMAYDNGKLIELSQGIASFDTDDAVGTELPVTAQITLPADISKVQVMSFFWDSALGMEPLAPGGIFASSDPSILSAKVEGINIPSFDENKSATVVLPVNAAAHPVVEVTCADATTTVVPTYSEENGEGIITLTATAHNGASDVYTINYTVTPPTIIARYSGATTYEDMKIVEGGGTIPSGGSVIPHRQTLRKPGTEITGAEDSALLTSVIEGISANLPGNVNEVETRRELFKGIEDYASRVYSDTWSIMYDVPDELVGKTRVVYDYYNGSSWDNNNGGANGYYWTVTIESDTRIWFSTRAYDTLKGDIASANLGCSTVTYLGDDGVLGGGDDENVSVTVTDYGDDFKFFVGDRTPTLTTTMAEVETGLIGLTDQTTPSSIGYHKIYKADLVLPEGAESATYIVGGHKPTGKYPAILCYDAIRAGEDEVTPDPEDPTPDPEPEEPVFVPALTEIKYDYNNHNDTLDYEDITTAHRVMKTPDSRLSDTTKTLVAALEGNASIDYATRAWSNRSHMYYESVPEELVGLNYIPMNYDNHRSGQRSQWKITTNNNVRIYFVSWPTEVISGAVEVEGVNIQTDLVIRPFVDSAISTTIIGDVATKQLASPATLYYYDLLLPAESDTASIEFRTRNTDFFPDVVMYEFIDNIVEEPTPDPEDPTPDPEVTELVFSATVQKNGVPTAVGMTNTVRKPTYVYDAANGNHQLGSALGDSAATIYNNYATRTNAHNYHFIQDCPDEMLGAVGTIWSNDALGTSSSMGSVDVTLTINRDATIYLDTTDEAVTSFGAVELDPIKTLQVVDPNGTVYSSVENWVGGAPDMEGNDYHGGRLFKIELNVPDGEDSATFVIPAAYYGSEHPFMFIK